MIPEISDLPAPGSIPPRNASELGGAFQRRGGDFRIDLPHNELDAAGDGDGHFTPDDAGASNRLANLAFGVYDWNLPEFSEEAVLTIDWDTEPADGAAFIGLSDWERNAWRWLALDAGQTEVDLTSAGVGLSDDGRFLAVMMVLGSTPADLDSLDMGRSLPYAPVPVLTVTPGEGMAPLGVLYKADASYDPDGSIVLYELDLDGDGEYESSSPEPFNSVELFTMPGNYSIGLRVTDDSGLSAATHCAIAVSAQVEWEEINIGAGENKPAVLWDCNGVPALSYRLDDQLVFQLAADPLGAGWRDPVVVDDAFVGTDTASLALVDGHPALAYARFDGVDYELRYFRALDSEGQAWPEPEYLGLGLAAEEVRLAVVHGKPAIAYGQVVDGLYRPMFARAEDAHGDEWADPVRADNGAFDELGITSRYNQDLSDMLIFEDRPCFIIHTHKSVGNEHSFLFCMAEDALGQQWRDIQEIAGPMPLVFYEPMQLLQVGYSGNETLMAACVFGDDIAVYRRPGGQQASWFFDANIGTVNLEANNIELAMVQGAPAVLISEGAMDDYQLAYLRSYDGFGDNWGPGVPAPFAELMDQPIDGYAGSELGMLGGQAAVIAVSWEGQASLFIRH